MTLAIIPASDFAYIARFASASHARPYLMGVCIEPGANVRLIATDGHIMGALLLGGDQGTATAGPPFILAAHKDLLRACKAIKGRARTIVCSHDRVEVFEEYDAIAPGTPVYTGYKPYVDGQFPDWRHVMPRVISGTRTYTRGDGTIAPPVGVNPELLARFAISDKNSGIAFSWNDSGPLLIATSDPRFIGVCMPMNGIMTDADILARRAHVLGEDAQAQQLPQAAE
jgi:hypothetical protein